MSTQPTLTNCPPKTALRSNTAEPREVDYTGGVAVPGFSGNGGIWGWAHELNTSRLGLPLPQLAHNLTLRSRFGHARGGDLF